MVDPKDFFADLLGTIEVAQEREAILASVKKDPKTAEMLAKINKLATDGEAYNNWYKTDWPSFKSAKENLATLQTQLEEATKTIETMKAGKGASAAPPNPPDKKEELDMESMTQEQLDKIVDDRIKAMGYVTKTEAESLAETKAREAAAGVTTRLFSHGLPMVETHLGLKAQYEKDFPGKAWNREGFDKFLGEHKFENLTAAYAEFTRPEYTDKIKADSFAQGEIAGDKKATERLTKENSELAARSLPVDMGGGSGIPFMPGAPPPEPVELEKIPTDYPIGQRGGFRLAAALAAKVKQDRAAGVRI